MIIMHASTRTVSTEFAKFVVKDKVDRIGNCLEDEHWALIVRLAILGYC